MNAERKPHAIAFDIGAEPLTEATLVDCLDAVFLKGYDAAKIVVSIGNLVQLLAETSSDRRYSLQRGTVEDLGPVPPKSQSDGENASFAYRGHILPFRLTGADGEVVVLL